MLLIVFFFEKKLYIGNIKSYFHKSLILTFFLVRDTGRYCNLQGLESFRRHRLKQLSIKELFCKLIGLNFFDRLD